MRIAVLSETAGLLRRGRRPDVDNVQTAGTCVRADRVGEAGILVDGDVVRRAELVVDRRWLELDRWVPDVAQLSQVEDLNAVLTGRIRHHEGVVAIDLDVTPCRRPGLGRQVPEIDGVLRIGHLDERRAVGSADEGVLAIAVAPTPDVVAVAAADLGELQVGQQVDAIAREDVGEAARTGGRFLERVGDELLAAVAVNRQ